MTDRRSLQRWTRLADVARRLDFSELKAARGRAFTLRRETDRPYRSAEEHMSVAMSANTATVAPSEADWRWRPDGWRYVAEPPGLAGAPSGAQFAEGISIFHDCKVSELTLRQIRNPGEAGRAPFGLKLDVFQFDGSFLSLVLNLPEAALDGLTRRHLVGLSLRLETERPLEIFARLNIRHGPNTEQLVREIPKGKPEVQVEFDLAYSELNEKRIETAWLDLIFEGPEMNQIALHDLTMHRRLRAEF